MYALHLIPASALFAQMFKDFTKEKLLRKIPKIRSNHIKAIVMHCAHWLHAIGIVLLQYYIVFNLVHFVEWARAGRLDLEVMAVWGNRLQVIASNDHSCNPHQFAWRVVMAHVVPEAISATCWRAIRGSQPQSPDRILAKMDWTWHLDSVVSLVPKMYFASSNSNRWHDLGMEKELLEMVPRCFHLNKSSHKGHCNSDVTITLVFV